MCELLRGAFHCEVTLRENYPCIRNVNASLTTKKSMNCKCIINNAKSKQACMTQFADFYSKGLFTAKMSQDFTVHT